MDLGVDVGGTNTDVVLVHRETVDVKDINVRDYVKVPTTHDIRGGVVDGIRSILAKTSTPPTAIRNVFIGTTQFVNAVVERSADLAQVAVIRLGGEFVKSVSSFTTLPQDLRPHVEGCSYVVDGGYNFLGAEASPLNFSQIKQACDDIKRRNILSVAIVGMFSTMCPSQEDDVEAFVAQELGPSVSITKSRLIGRKDLILREHSAVLNAALRPLACRVVSGFIQAMKDLSMRDARVFLTQNDGTVLSISDALQFPVKTLGSGPTNTMRGAKLILEGTKTCCTTEELFVCDIGGTTSDIGVIDATGFPRVANLQVEVGGVLLNSRIPDTNSVALGGGSVIDLRKRTIGPESVGYNIINDGIVFGGDVLTPTDIAVRLGYASVGDASRVAAVNEEDARSMLEVYTKMVEEGVRKMKTQSDDVTLLLCGGGAIIFPDSVAFAGVSKVIRPPFSCVANAIGAAFAQVGADLDILVDLSKESLLEAKAKAKDALIDAAVAKGAVRSTVTITSLEDHDVKYLKSPAAHITGRAIGSMDFSRASTIQCDDVQCCPTGTPHNKTVLSSVPLRGGFANHPSVDSHGVWTLSLQDVEYIAVGTGVLGVGGGGNTYQPLFRVKEMIEQGKPIRVIERKALTETDTVFSVGFVGAPTVFVEQIGNGKEICGAADAMSSHTGTKPTAICSIEAAGANGLEPFVIAAQKGIYCIDGDCMGRAFPFLRHYLPFHFSPLGPITMCGTLGNSVVFESQTMQDVESTLRDKVVNDFGAIAALCMPPLTKANVCDDRMFVENTVSLAWRIGRCLAQSKETKSDPIDNLLQLTQGHHVVTGIISGISTAESGGFSTGTLQVTSSCGSVFDVTFQNEYLVCTHDGHSVATVPDMISILNADTKHPIFCDELRFGVRIIVLVMPSPSQYRTGSPADVTQPAEFGLSNRRHVLDYTRPPIVSVCEEFRALSTN